MEIAVAICTYNPREDYLRRVLEALRAQTLPMEQWRLLLVDNGSPTPLDAQLLAWHPHGEVLREEQLGKTNALVRAIRHTTEPLLITVDDDNVLEPDYLEQCLRISQEHPEYGAWGSGNITGEFETLPDPAFKPYTHCYALRDNSTDLWGNLQNAMEMHIPVGAGMCTRRPIMDAWATLVEQEPLRRELSHTGTALLHSEDTEIAMLACDMDYGLATLLRLRLTHLIPSRRLNWEYLKRYCRGTTEALTLMSYLRGRKFPLTQGWGGSQGKLATKARFTLRRLLKYVLCPNPRRIVELALLDGEERALERIRQLQNKVAQP